MANRMQRRAQAKAERQSLVAGYTNNRRMASLIQNGITPEDTRREYDRGRRDGFREASMPIFKTCLAAACIALQEEGMSEDDIYRVVSVMSEKIIYCLNHQEIVEEAMEKTGIELRMDDPLEPVQQV